MRVPLAPQEAGVDEVRKCCARRRALLIVKKSRATKMRFVIVMCGVRVSF